MKHCARFLSAFLLLTSSVLANNLRITSVTLTGQNAGSGYTNVKFTIAWDNSWRDVINHDAAWVFVKYKSGPVWKHASLSTSAGDHVAATGSTILPSDDGKGVFLYRSASGEGDVNYADVELRWEYAADSVSDNAVVTVQVFGIEMVYVPQGEFYAGDGSALYTGYGTFSAGTSTQPFLVSSEGALTLGGTGASSVGNRTPNWSYTYMDDFSNESEQTLPSSFPKGYNAFYCMKYEGTEGLWVDFFNTLTPAQKLNHDITDSNHKNADTTKNRNTISWTSTDAITMRPDRACGYMYPDDILAFLDWAGLRPMTELEYEKACRGDQSPVAHEYAWGTTTIVPASQINGPEDGTETISTPGANMSDPLYGFTGGDEGSNYSTGRLRSGIFAKSSTTREQAGSSYYGIMEMTGNAFEPVVTVGKSAGRSFTGLHGDGALDASGYANVGYWPSGTTGGLGLKVSEVSDRRTTTFNFNGLFIGTNGDPGFRGVRTAP